MGDNYCDNQAEGGKKQGDYKIAGKEVAGDCASEEADDGEQEFSYAETCQPDK